MVFLLCCHKPEKKRIRGKCFHYCTSRRLCQRVRERSFPKSHGTDAGRCSHGQPRPFVMPGTKTLYHHSHSPAFMQPAMHLLKPVTFPVYILLCRKKDEEFYMILTATAAYWICKILLHFLEEAHILIGKEGKNKTETATNSKWVALINLMDQKKKNLMDPIAVVELGVPCI